MIETLIISIAIAMAIVIPFVIYLLYVSIPQREEYRKKHPEEYETEKIEEILRRLR